MQNELKIAGLNMDIHWENTKANFNLIGKEFADTNADVFLLPEMFPTGFSMDAEKISDRGSAALSWMKDFAQTKGAAVAGSVSVAENDRFFNRFYFVKPCGEVHFYDKRHLFSYSGEDKIYSPGKERTILEYKGLRIMLQICYDLRFPVFSRNRNDYDVILYVANWPAARVEAWRHLLKARAIENLACVFGLNRIGVDGNGLSYEESSLAFFADGSEISTHCGNIVSANFNLDNLKKFREKFRFLKDGDDFEIII